MALVAVDAQPTTWEFHLGSIFFNTCGEPDDLGCTWAMPTPDGWFSPESRVTTTDVPFADGAEISHVFFGARILHGVGSVIAPTWAALDQAIRRLHATTRLVDPTAPGLFVGRETDGDWGCSVLRGGKTAITSRHGTPGGQSVAEFDFLLIAGDPHKYATVPTVVAVQSSTLAGGFASPFTSPVVSTPDTDTLTATSTSTNAGDLDTPIVVTFHGPLTGPLLVDRVSGRRLGLTVDVPAGRTVVVDAQYQTVMADETSLYSALDPTSSPLDTLVVPGDGSCAWLLLGAGPGSAVVTSSSAKE